MKIVLDSYRKTVRDKRDRADKHIDQYQKEADVMNIFAFAIAARAKKYFQGPLAQRMFVDYIYKTAVAFLDCDGWNRGNE